MTAKFGKSYGFQFPDGTTQATAATPNIATGQTWQNLGSSRVVSVAYLNSTIRPIQVMIGRAGADSQTTTASVGATASTLVTCGSTTIDRYGGSNTITFIVPPNYFYQVSGAFGSWWESR
jgi:hypothetical protein